MPNIAGREFAYTPQGMAAAQQYKQSLGMRGGGMMGFRPVGYANGNLVESIGKATQRGVSAAMGAPVDAADAALGAVGLGATTPVGGAESISNAIDTVAALVQQFTAQGIPEPVKNAVNAAIGTHGIPIDLVNSALRAIGVPVSDNPIGGSRNLTETFGMRDGGPMGFRPVGYQEGTGPAGVQPGGSPETEERLVQQFNLVLEGGSPGQIRTFITDHMDRLLAAAGNYPGLVEQITNSINSTVSANRGELLAPPGTGEYFIHENPDVPWTANTRDAYLGGGYPGPSFVPSGSQTAPDFEARIEELRRFGDFQEGQRLPAPLPPPLPPGMEIANGGYVGRGRRGLGGGGIMSLRR